MLVIPNRTPLPVGNDCNGNGQLDSCDIADGVSTDADENAIPDECEPGGFLRGDPNADGIRNIADAIFILAYLFGGGPAPSCLDAGDPNDDGIINISDAIRALGHLFDGASIPEPLEACGADPTDDDELGCAAFAPCQ